MADPHSIKWLVISLYPDVVLTKGAPVPYVIMTSAEVAELCSSNVAANGQCSLTVDSICTRCEGDESGDAGIKSGKVADRCEPHPKAYPVFINSSVVLQEGDLVFMNDRNTTGKIIMIPAVDSPSDSHDLDDAEFDLAVAELISQALTASGGDADKAQSILTSMRNPQYCGAPNDNPSVYNNPVVVAAEYFLVAAGNMPTVNSFTILLWEGSKLVPGDPFEPWRDALTAGTTNAEQKASGFDSRALKWALRGTAFRGKGKLAVSSIRKLLCPPPKPPEVSPHFLDLKELNRKRETLGLPPLMP